VGRNAGLYTRTGDVLLPLAIGPEQDPTLANPEDQWMTLSEALALSMDYYSPQSTSLFYQFGHSDDSKPIVMKPKADRGNFVLDDYAPFYDVNGDGAWSPGAGTPFRPGLPNGPAGPLEAPGDYSLGLGIPLALNLLDKFRIFDRTTIDFHDGLTKGTSGLLNINTTALAATSALPLLFPDAALVGRAGAPPMPWMTHRGTVDTDAPLTPPVALFDPAQQSFDVATTIQTYRDKSQLPARPIGASPPQVISFQNNPSVSGRTRPDGRYLHTAIPGLHESPGFRSIGEIMAANIRQTGTGANFGAPLRRTAQIFTNSIDHLGNDGDAILGYPGIDTATFHNPLLGGTDLHDLAADDYAEKLAIATAALGTISVRSDTFCVYFLVRGYLPSDVEVGPDVNTPMIPSIQRRYMMVIDRSNVVKAGDKPRVLLFQEVPL